MARCEWWAQKPATSGLHDQWKAILACIYKSAAPLIAVWKNDFYKVFIADGGEDVLAPVTAHKDVESVLSTATTSSTIVNVSGVNAAAKQTFLDE
jgi:hypothetical protein